MEHSDLQGQIEAHRDSVQSVQLDTVRLATDVELEALAVHDLARGVLLLGRVGHVLLEVHTVDQAESFPRARPPRLHVARGRRGHARVLRVPGQPVSNFNLYNIDFFCNQQSFANSIVLLSRIVIVRRWALRHG